MEERIKLLIRSLGEDRAKKDIDLSEHLATRLGGPAKVFYIATTTRELTRAVQLCRELKIMYLIIGLGSKMAIVEEGFPGLIIKNRTDNLKIFGIKGKVSRAGIGIEEALVEADSGVSLVKLAEFTSAQGLGGFEIFTSTLGTVGGSLYMIPALREKASQIKVLTMAGKLKTKHALELLKEDIILGVVFKLNAKKAI